jgi:pyruvate/2-oxoglutarate dehydrogenase complex dihydrolipoamide dehydrogenase (E3) component/uncharacterized membrane protein YdjX (TVP38/TMEM64 family)
MKKIIIVILGILVIVPFFVFGFNDLLTLKGIQSHLGEFYTWRDQSPLIAGGIFFVVYVLITGFSLPGAAIMTLLAGALFGLFWGTLLASFASSIGALLAFLASRFVLRDVIQKKFAEKLKAVNQGIERDGPFYLFTLRLMPLFPFFLVNILMGLTTIRVRTYYWVSQVGMFLGTLVYVNAGTQLSHIKNLGGIVSPTLLGSFVLLAVFPLVAKRILDYTHRRRIYKKWQKPKSFDQNLVVIGAGAAGLVTSYIASVLRAKVTLVESHKMGGDCLNYGCVPSKALIKSARVAHDMAHADVYGLEPYVSKFSFKHVMERVQQVIRAVEPHDSVERYTQLGVNVVQGYATIVDPWTVEITQPNGTKQRLTTKSIVIAAGAQPFIPSLAGLEEVGYLTSDTMWDEFSKRDEIPSRIVVLGGGPIGCELSQAFARLGAEVFQLEMGERIMPREDEDVSSYAKTKLQADGVQVLTEHKALRCELIEGSKRIVVEYQGQQKIIEFDALIVAVGRSARLTGYGLEQLGIETERTVVTNDYLETIYPNIFAAGDVAGPYQFTHTAAHQAWYAAVNALMGNLKKFKVDYRIIPWVTFIDPEVARVGLNEQDAKAQGIAYQVTSYAIDDLDRAITDSNNYGWVKVLTVPNKDKILGVTIVGAQAGELLAEYVLAMKHGLGLNKILGTIHTYPTMAEANKYAAGEWKRAHTPHRLLDWVEKYHNWMRG